MIINELFDRQPELIPANPRDYIDEGVKGAVYEFVIDGKKFAISFWQSKSDEDTFDCDFGNVDYDSFGANIQHEITSLGIQYKVLPSVIAGIRKFLAEFSPMRIEFIGHSARHDKFYLKMIKYFETKCPPPYRVDVQTFNDGYIVYSITREILSEGENDEPKENTPDNAKEVEVEITDREYFDKDGNLIIGNDTVNEEEVDESQDVPRIRLASSIFEHFNAWFKSNLIDGVPNWSQWKSYHNAQFNATTYFVSASDIGITDHPLLNFGVTTGVENIGGWQDTVNLNGRTEYVVVEIVSGNTWKVNRKLYVHEIIHYLDRLDGAEYGVSKYFGKEYYLSDMEFNAYFGQTVDEILTYFDTHKNIESYPTYAAFSAQFSQYFEPQFVAHINGDANAINKFNSRFQDVYEYLKTGEIPDNKFDRVTIKKHKVTNPGGKYDVGDQDTHSQPVPAPQPRRKVTNPGGAYLNESPETDVAKFKYAERLYDAFKNWIDRNIISDSLSSLIPNMLRLKFSGDMTYFVTGEMIGLGPIRNDLLIGFTWSENRTRGGFQATSKNSDTGKPVFLVVQVLPIGEDSSYALTKETYIHELTHYADRKRQQSKMPDGGLTGKFYSGTKIERSKEEYFNDPLEFNAYFQEGALKIFNHIFSGDETAFFLDDMEWCMYSFDRFKKSFKDYFSFSFREHLNPEYKKKFERRLYKLWEHIKAEFTNKYGAREGKRDPSRKWQDKHQLENRWNDPNWP